MQSWLSVENDDVTVPDVPIHLLVLGSWANSGGSNIVFAPLRGQQLASERNSLVESQLIQRNLGTVLVLNKCGTGMNFRTVDYELTELSNILLGNRFRIREFLGEDRRDTDFVGLNIDVGRYDRSGGIVHSLALHDVNTVLRCDRWNH